MATPSYKERMAAARAAARAQRQAEHSAWKRMIELECEVRRLALDAVKAGIRARGDKLQLYTPAQLLAQADEMIGPWLVAQARPGLPRGRKPKLRRRLPLCKYHDQNELRNDRRLRSGIDRWPRALKLSTRP